MNELSPRVLFIKISCDTLQADRPWPVQERWEVTGPMNGSSLGTLTTDPHKETINHPIEGGDPGPMTEVEIDLVLEGDLGLDPKRGTDQITKPIHLTLFGISIDYLFTPTNIFCLDVKKRGIVDL